MLIPTFPNSFQSFDCRRMLLIFLFLSHGRKTVANRSSSCKQPNLPAAMRISRISRCVWRQKRTRTHVTQTHLYTRTGARWRAAAVAPGPANSNKRERRANAESSSRLTVVLESARTRPFQSSVVVSQNKKTTPFSGSHAPTHKYLVCCSSRRVHSRRQG